MSLLSVVEICEKIEKIAGPEVRINFSYTKIHPEHIGNTVLELIVIWPEAEVSRSYVFLVDEIRYSLFSDSIYDDVMNNIQQVSASLESFRLNLSQDM